MPQKKKSKVAQQFYPKAFAFHLAIQSIDIMSGGPVIIYMESHGFELSIWIGGKKTY